MRKSKIKAKQCYSKEEKKEYNQAYYQNYKEALREKARQAYYSKKKEINEKRRLKRRFQALTKKAFRTS